MLNQERPLSPIQRKTPAGVNSIANNLKSDLWR
jgi:hypothetical protein